MRFSDYRHVLTCALVYGLAVVLARFAFEDGSNAATVVSVRCAFAALAIGIALRLSGEQRRTTGRERSLLLVLGLVFALGVFSFYKAIEILRVPLAILTFYVNTLIIGADSSACRDASCCSRSCRWPALRSPPARPPKPWMRRASLTPCSRRR